MRGFGSWIGTEKQTAPRSSAGPASTSPGPLRPPAAGSAERSALGPVPPLEGVRLLPLESPRPRESTTRATARSTRGALAQARRPRAGATRRRPRQGWRALSNLRQPLVPRLQPSVSDRWRALSVASELRIEERAAHPRASPFCVCVALHAGSIPPQLGAGCFIAP